VKTWHAIAAVAAFVALDWYVRRFLDDHFPAHDPHAAF
jgi:hypothetical protein